MISNEVHLTGPWLVVVVVAKRLVVGTIALHISMALRLVPIIYISLGRE